MDDTEDDHLTNLSWLKFSNNSESQSTVECSNNSIDDELQCLCWIVKMRPNSYPSHSLKRLSSTIHRNKYFYQSNQLNYSSNRMKKSTIDNRITNDNSTSRRILMVRTLNNHVSTTEFYQQSLILIRSLNGQISCLFIRHSGMIDEMKSREKETLFRLFFHAKYDTFEIDHKTKTKRRRK
ncbi:hypothetical protein I4U23_024720 [Adineta vaga]|nr:hypothetical protein I4U23_024720 [Adineta vaga]